jgi:hypothetical protein
VYGSSFGLAFIVAEHDFISREDTVFTDINIVTGNKRIVIALLCLAKATMAVYHD